MNNKQTKIKNKYAFLISPSKSQEECPRTHISLKAVNLALQYFDEISQKWQDAVNKDSDDMETDLRSIQLPPFNTAVQIACTANANLCALYELYILPDVIGHHNIDKTILMRNIDILQTIAALERQLPLLPTVYRKLRPLSMLPEKIFTNNNTYYEVLPAQLTPAEQILINEGAILYGRQIRSTRLKQLNSHLNVIQQEIDNQRLLKKAKKRILTGIAGKIRDIKKCNKNHTLQISFLHNKSVDLEKQLDAVREKINDLKAMMYSVCNNIQLCQKDLVDTQTLHRKTYQSLIRPNLKKITDYINCQITWQEQKKTARHIAKTAMHIVTWQTNNLRYVDQFVADEFINYCIIHTNAMTKLERERLLLILTNYNRLIPEILIAFNAVPLIDRSQSGPVTKKQLVQQLAIRDLTFTVSPKQRHQELVRKVMNSRCRLIHSLTISLLHGKARAFKVHTEMMQEAEKYAVTNHAAINRLAEQLRLPRKTRKKLQADGEAFLDKIRHMTHKIKQHTQTAQKRLYIRYPDLKIAMQGDKNIGMRLLYELQTHLPLSKVMQRSFPWICMLCGKAKKYLTILVKSLYSTIKCIQQHIELPYSKTIHDFIARHLRQNKPECETFMKRKAAELNELQKDLEHIRKQTLISMQKQNEALDEYITKQKQLTIERDKQLWHEESREFTTKITNFAHNVEQYLMPEDNATISEIMSRHSEESNNEDLTGAHEEIVSCKNNVEGRINTLFSDSQSETQSQSYTTHGKITT